MFQFLKATYNSLTTALKKTRRELKERLTTLFKGPLNAALLDGLEEILYEADFGVKIAAELTKKTEHFLRRNPAATGEEALNFLEQEISSILAPFEYSLKTSATTPTAILVVGANGNGKTTFIAKLATHLMKDGKKVLVAAADTFRAGAQEQLGVHAKNCGFDVIIGNYKADPAAIVFDALQAARSRNSDVVLIDTAGRLENKSHLMKELEKIRRTGQKVIPEFPHETLLVLDATIGQNGISIAKAFHECVPLTGLVLTKIDGTAKGGTAVAIQKELNLPIKFLGTGESVQDLTRFDPQEFAHSLFFDE